jgi:hypothetical protein
MKALATPAAIAINSIIELTQPRLPSAASREPSLLGFLRRKMFSAGREELGNPCDKLAAGLGPASWPKVWLKGRKSLTDIVGLHCIHFDDCWRIRGRKPKVIIVWIVRRLGS